MSTDTTTIEAARLVEAMTQLKYISGFCEGYVKSTYHSIDFVNPDPIWWMRGRMELVKSVITRLSELKHRCDEYVATIATNSIDDTASLPEIVKSIYRVYHEIQADIGRLIGVSLYAKI